MLSSKDKAIDIKEEYSTYLEKLSNVLSSLNPDKLNKLFSAISKRVGTKSTIFISGNGGSAATASHMSCDLTKTTLGSQKRNAARNLRVISINDNIPLVTALSNDQGYKFIFADQIENLSHRGDLLLAITASGNSENIIEAIRMAKKLGVETFGLLGFDGGQVKKELDEYILIESFDYGIVEDSHLILNHFITKCLKDTLANL